MTVNVPEISTLIRLHIYTSYSQQQGYYRYRDAVPTSHIRRLLFQSTLPQLWNSHSRGQFLATSLHFSNFTSGKPEDRTIFCSLVDCIHLSFNCGTECFHGNVHLIQTKWTIEEREINTVSTYIHINMTHSAHFITTYSTSLEPITIKSMITIDAAAMIIGVIQQILALQTNDARMKNVKKLVIVIAS